MFAPANDSDRLARLLLVDRHGRRRLGRELLVPMVFPPGTILGPIAWPFPNDHREA